MLRKTQGSRLRGWTYTPSFSPESRALFTRFTSPPSLARQILINNLIASLVAGGVWAKLDALYVMAQYDAQAARQNWVANQFNLTEVASPNFLADRGYQGNGTTSYLTTGLVIGTGTISGQDDNHQSSWSLTNVASTAVDIGCNATFMQTRNNVSLVTRNMNAGSVESVAVADSLGMTTVSRLNGAGYDRYRNAVSLGNATRTSTLTGNAALNVGARNNSGTPDMFSNRRLAYTSIGRGLSAGEVTSFYAALLTYMQAVGAA